MECIGVAGDYNKSQYNCIFCPRMYSAKFFLFFFLYLIDILVTYFIVFSIYFIFLNYIIILTNILTQYQIYINNCL